MRKSMHGYIRPQIVPSHNINRRYAIESRAANRGMFVTRYQSKFRDILDGLANTIAMGEIATDLGDHDSRTISARHPARGGARIIITNNPRACIEETSVPMIDPARPRFWSANNSFEPVWKGRGYAWADMTQSNTGFHTVTPPNSPLCIPHGSNATALMTASSRHQGGVHVLMGDGAVVFITDSIESGDQHHAMVWHAGTVALDNRPGRQSPYGLWGALGTRASGETIEEQLNQ
jgi:prepilin-type processing-associated H-X9-DG protein